MSPQPLHGYLSISAIQPIVPHGIRIRLETIPAGPGRPLLSIGAGREPGLRHPGRRALRIPMPQDHPAADLLAVLDPVPEPTGIGEDLAE